LFHGRSTAGEQVIAVDRIDEDMGCTFCQRVGGVLHQYQRFSGQF